MTNRYLADFLEVAKQRFSDDNTRMSMSEWMVKNTRHPKSKSQNPKPFSFAGYEFQKKIADDMHPDMSVIKVSQVGLTEIQARKFLGILKRFGPLTGIFTLPTDEMFERVSKARVGPIVNDEPIFNQPTSSKPIRSMALYQIDNSFGYFTGNKESDATSIPADFIFHDELDLSDQSKIALFLSRLNNSTFKVRQKFSTPSYPGYGIDAEYELGDKHEYMLRCECCRHYQVPVFSPQFVHLNGAPDIASFTELSDTQLLSVDYEKSFIFCEKCGEKLNLNDPELREWVPMRPGAPKRSYRIRTFSVPNRSLYDICNQLIEYRRLDNLRGWHNTMLGEAYADAKARLTESQIRSVMTSGDPPMGQPCFIGIDVGQICHVVVGTQNAVFYWQRVHVNDLQATVSQLMKQYPIVAGALDRHPYTPTAEAIRDATKSIILPVEYRGTVPVALVKDRTDFVTHAQGSRTTMIDAVAEAVRKKTTNFIQCEDERDLIVAHLQDMVREEEMDGKQAVWKKLTGKDHYFHALAFYQFAQRMHYVKHFDGDAEPREMVGTDRFKVFNLESRPFALKSRRVSNGNTLWHR